MPATAPDLPRNVLAVLFLAALIAACFWILRPFLLAGMWATMIVVASWPLLLQLQVWLGNRRGLAVAVMTIILLLVLVIPMSFGVVTLVDHADEIAGWAQAVATMKLPPPPDVVVGLPFVGQKIANAWSHWVGAGAEDFAARLAPYIGGSVKWFVGQAGSFGRMTVDFLLTIVISAILYAHGETAAEAMSGFARRLAGARGENSVRLAGQAIRGVALGVVVTAVLQSACAGLGLAVVGIPFPVILTALIFLLAIAQIGPTPVLLLAIIWLYWSGESLRGTVLLIWSIPVAVMDNFLRPILIRRGADLPLLLIFTGVIGGLVAFGLVGIFVGPVVLAVSYTLLQDWVRSDTTE